MWRTAIGPSLRRVHAVQGDGQRAACGERVHGRLAGPYRFDDVTCGRCRLSGQVPKGFDPMIPAYSVRPGMVLAKVGPDGGVVGVHSVSVSGGMVAMILTETGGGVLLVHLAEGERVFWCGGPRP
jgi:hypothetical protein